MISQVSQLSWFFLFAFALNSLIAIVKLIFKNDTLRVAHFLLAINMFGISMAAIMMSLVQSGLILNIPYFYRVPSPVYYMVFPAAYLYVRLILTDKTRLVWTDYLHFLPAFLHLIELIPYFSLNIEEKLKYINLVTNQSVAQWALYEGWLPAFAHNIMRGIQSVIYSIAMWRLIRNSSLLTTLNRFSATAIQWLKTFTFLNVIIGLVTIGSLSLTLLPPEVRAFAIQLVFLVALLIFNFYLFFRPEILYGIPQPVLVNSREVIETTDLSNEPEPNHLQSEIPLFIYQYKTKVDVYLTKTQRYLEPDFSLQDMSRDTQIPKHHLQLLINKLEGRKFNEYINYYRILHLQNCIEIGGMKTKTLEGLALESGFSSKATFIRAVKKQTGKNPKEYFNSEKAAINPGISLN